ncbi:hypothetical protein TNCV_3015801 [Trichonephila clavipes]|nr:hypothetical protein TNCV_3015801 [Trichonephila clavipes]
MHNATVLQPFTTVSSNSNPTIAMLHAEAGFVSKHNVVPLRYPCPTFMEPSAAQACGSQSRAAITVAHHSCLVSSDMLAISET